MENFLVILFASYGLSFFLKEKDGPFDFMTKLRAYLFKNKVLGVFFFKLFECKFCLGFHTGWLIALLYAKIWQPNLLFCWGLACGVGHLILSAALARMTVERE